ncbi:MAG: hypothetical protein ACRCV6_04950 [Formosimonas sp.]
MTPVKFNIANLAREHDFLETVEACAYGLQQLGHEVVYERGIRSDCINIVLGAQLDWGIGWAELLSDTKARVIIYNQEQVASDVPCFMSPRYFSRMTKHQVWDYSTKNIAELERAGILNASLVPISYCPSMSRIPRVQVQDIDVLFFGVMSVRRREVLERCRALGLNVVAFEGGLTGATRDEYVARAKVVLNVHYYEKARVLEMGRIGYLLANHKAVVSELAHDTEVADDIRHALAVGSLNDLPQLCFDLVHDEARRRVLEQKGFEIFSRHSAVDTMRTALAHYFAQPQHGQRDERCVPLPKILQLDAGEQWRYIYCNLHADAELAPDVCWNISNPIAFGQKMQSWRFGRCVLEAGYFDKIVAHNVFQRVENLKTSLTNCLNLLKDGGELELSVPVDISYDAWMDVDDRRSFNEKTWKRLLSQSWKFGWKTHCFDIVSQSLGVHDVYGFQVLAEQSDNWDAALKIPRAIDTISLTLRKRPLTYDEVRQLPVARFLD